MLIFKIKLKELNQRFNEKYEEVYKLNDDCVEKGYTLKQQLNDMAHILEQKYTLLIQDPEELVVKLKDVCSEI